MKKLILFILFSLIIITCKAPITKFTPSYRVIKIDGGTYDNLEIDLIITKDTQIVRNFINKTIKNGDTSYSLENIEAITMYSPGYPIVVWLPYIPTKPIEYGTLNHELFHALTFSMEYLSFPLNEQTYEVWAYQFGYMTKKIYYEIDKIKQE